MLYNEGNVALVRFTDVLKIPKAIIDDMLLWMQKEHLVEVSKASVELGRLSNVYTLTGGRGARRSAMERSQYVGPVPVAIPYYNRRHRAANPDPHQGRRSDQVRSALRHLILPENFHRQIGPAVNAGRPCFCTGRQATVRPPSPWRLPGCSPAPIRSGYLMPSLPVGRSSRSTTAWCTSKSMSRRAKPTEFGRIDQRWALIERPAVTVGGELKMESLDLRFDPIAKFYEASLQLKANGGMFLIDDFGRQQVSYRPAQPLDRSAGKQHRLPAPAERPDHRRPFPPADRLQHQPRPEAPGG